MPNMFVANSSKEIFMAESVKTTKAPAKPRKVATKTKAVAEAPKAVVEAPKGTMPSREEVERLARQYWASRGYQDGYAEQDWLRAENELRKKAS
jgi:Protein of unknown function (DUF2934)